MKFHNYVVAVIGVVSVAATAHAVDTVDITDGAVTTPKLATGAVTAAKIKDAAVTSAKLATGAVSTAKIKDAAVTSAKLAANVLDRPVDIIWLESDGTTWNLAAKYRNLDGQMDTGYRKVPFSAANNIDFGITSSMAFDDATDSVTINKEGLYAFRFRNVTLAGASAVGEHLPINVEINIIRGETRMRILDANGIAEAYESNAAGEVLFPAKVGDVVYAVAAYSSGPGLNASMSMAKLGYLRNRTMSIVLVHPGPAGTLQ